MIDSEKLYIAELALKIYMAKIGAGLQLTSYSQCLEKAEKITSKFNKYVEKELISKYNQE
jgi:hypothetical protein